MVTLPWCGSVRASKLRCLFRAQPFVIRSLVIRPLMIRLLVIGSLALGSLAIELRAAAPMPFALDQAPAGTNSSLEQLPHPEEGLHSFTLYYGLQRFFRKSSFGEEPASAHGFSDGGLQAPVVGIHYAFFARTPQGVPLGLGVELNQYRKDIRLSATSKHESTAAAIAGTNVLFRVMTWRQRESWLFYGGVGMGSSFLSWRERKPNWNTRTAAEDVYNLQGGVHYLWARWSIRGEIGFTRAQAQLATSRGGGRVELGGPYLNLGVSLLW